MIKCSFCGHDNPEGRTSCEDCRTDLTVSPSAEADSDLEVPTLQLRKIGIVHNLSRETPEESSGSAAGRPETTTPTAAGELTSPVSPSSGQKSRLVVVRGEKIEMQYPLYPGKNYLGRTDDKPVDIDLECQEAADRIWTSRQHAVISIEDGVATIEDLNSLNGTFVNRTRVHPGQVRTLQPNDVIQVGTVQLRFVVG